MHLKQDKMTGDSLRSGPGVASLTDRDLLHTEEWIGNVGSPTDLARKLGYQYILWNDRVYHVEADALRDTGLSEGDVH